MIRTLLYRPQDRSVQLGDEALIADWERESDSLLWVDLADNEAAAEQQLLSQRFGLHRLAIQDAQRARHQPKI